MKRVLVVGVLGAAAPAHAQPEVGVTLGAHAFSSELELGVDDRMDVATPATGPLFGIRAGFLVLRNLAAEGELVVIPTKEELGGQTGDSALVLGMRAHARFDFHVAAFRPFVVAGIGTHVLRTTSPNMVDDADRAYHWGGGVRYALGERLEVRLDLRHLVVPDRTLDGATSDFELAVGALWRFGSPPPARRSGESANGPLAAADTDGDRIQGAADQCPTKPEDEDGFEDGDGCPDIDNDADGIVDTVDRCPTKPETRNGWQDEDGCEDIVIAELTGINFEHESAAIDELSGPLLDLALKILKDHPFLHIEISGHTATEGTAEQNLELSLRRAQAVKDWLVQRGIAERRIVTVGRGSEVPIAPNDTPANRARNRRIEFRILHPDEVPK